MKAKLGGGGLASLFLLAWLAAAQADDIAAAQADENGATRGANPGAAGADSAAATAGTAPGDPANGLERLRATAAGDAEAQFRLGALYDAGEGVERDPGKALAAYRRAAEQGHPGAQYALAHGYHLGNGVEPDMAAALVWYRKAALQGDQSAQLALGDQYRIGLAVPRDLAQSVRWYRMAAEQGNAFARYELANAYRYGHGVQASLVQAIKWYLLAAEAGNPSAQLALAELEAADAVAAGKPVPESPPEPMSGTELASGSGPVAPEISPPASEEETIAGLLARADEQAARLALTTPAGDNAYETYQEVLAAEPDNRAAHAGIERIGVAYVDLARQAAAKGELASARRYAEKAEALAPAHPAVQAMAIPVETARAAAPGASPGEPEPAKPAQAAVPATAPAKPDPTPAAATAPAPAEPSDPVAEPSDPVADTDDLVFRPDAYDGRRVVVSGSVVRLLGHYRLTSESGQNSLVIETDGLNQADREKLRAAVESAGFLGRVRARIAGRIERETPVTFTLAASALTLEGEPERAPTGEAAVAAREPEAAPEAGRPTEAESPPLALLEPPAATAPAKAPAKAPANAPAKAPAKAPANAPTAGASRWVEPVALPAPAPAPAPAATTVSATAPATGPATPVRQAQPAYVPTCYQDTVWRRLPDGRIQTGTRTRCY